MTQIEPDEHPGQPSGGQPEAVSQEDPDALLQRVESDLTTAEFALQRARVFRRAAELLRAQGRAAEGQRAEWRA